jgi:hypothetical protein
VSGLRTRLTGIPDDQVDAIVALVDRLRVMTPKEVADLVAAGAAARAAAGAAAGAAARAAAGVAARDAARDAADAAWDAAVGLVVLDLAPDMARTLLGPVVSVLGTEWAPEGIRDPITGGAP